MSPPELYMNGRGKTSCFLYPVPGFRSRIAVGEGKVVDTSLHRFDVGYSM